MLDQFDLIHNTEWNTLCILDACRYDYFKKYNKLRGRLRECRSRGHHTWVWTQENFPDWYDWTYFSAHPYIGDKVRAQSWNAPQHFSKIVPIWRFGWDERLGTVKPDVVGETVKNTPYKKAVVHYVQPHGPWIGYPNRWLNPWTLMDVQKHQVMGDWVAVAKKPDPKFFRKCYRDNLKLVLKSVEKYLPYFKPPVVITADHGELLGEKGLYLHGAVEKSRAHLPYPKWGLEFLKHVPWFQVSEAYYSAEASLSPSSDSIGI